VTDAVHAKGGVIYAQLWHVGRCTVKENLGGRQPWSSVAVKLEGGANMFNPSGKLIPYEDPHQMTEEDMKVTLEDYAHAAKGAVEQGGFDGVQIHGANGYLIDQFLCDNINNRTDKYGGASVENRARFPLQIVDAVVAAIGADRVGIRFSPFGTFQGAGDSDPVKTWTYVLENIRAKHQLSFIEIVEPKSDFVTGGDSKIQRMRERAELKGISADKYMDEEVTMKPFRRTLLGSGIPLISNGGWDASSDYSHVGDKSENGVDAICIGRLFISNPDLPERLRTGKELTKYNRKTFYTPGKVGYTDYPTVAMESEVDSNISRL
jgi:2,4-dienoyl-CoA reductase-like NADH-dependent reductase (Old Yellow Enzyme family)